MAVLRDWLITFAMMVGKPIPQTFINESIKAKGKFSSAVAWLVLVVVSINVYNYVVCQYVFSPFTFVASILFLPIVLLFFVFCVHMLYQRLFNRKTDYHAELLYAFVGIFVPFIIANLIFATIPGIVGKILSWVTLVYPVILMVMAVMVITKLRIWQALVTVILGLMLATAGLFCIPAFILSVMYVLPRMF